MQTRMKRYTLFTIVFVLLTVIGYSQPTPAAVEEQINHCLDKKIKSSEWINIKNAFEAYLVACGFGSNGATGSAYMKFLEHESSFPPKARLPLPDRAKLKELLTSTRLMNGTNTYSDVFIECFYKPHQDFEKLKQSPVKDAISIASVLTQMDIASRIIYGSLVETFNESDLEKDIFRKAVILVCLPELIYREEINENTAGNDNPILRMIVEEKRKEEEQQKLDQLAQQSKPDATAEPEDGFDNYQKLIDENNKKLTKSKALGKPHFVVVMGTVDESGNLTRIGVWRGIGRGYDEEAHRIITNHPVKKWKPAMKDGKAVQSDVEITVDFRVLSDR